MPKINVEIKWDKPNDKNWLNVFNIELALRNACENTKFRVMNLDSGVVSSDSWK